MSTVAPNSEDRSPTDKENGAVDHTKELDAGTLFVLKSRGSWLHCGYHMTTAIVAPALLSIPYALGLLGWVGGVISLTAAGLVTFYSYNLLSIVLEHYAQLGRRQLRFRDMAHDILGPGWGRYFVGPLQLGICYGAVIACTLLGGQSLRFIYLLSRPSGGMQLYHFVIIFGAMMLVLAQMPSFHSLRHINLVSIILILAYCACTTAAAIYIGNSEKAPPKNYSITGVGINRIFGAINAISIIATTYGNGIIPEIQATLVPPVTGKMFKGLLLCYAIVISTYFSVGISGYWAFGNQVQQSVLQNFMVDGKPLVPKWFLLMTNVFTFLQVSAVVLVYYPDVDGSKLGLLATDKHSSREQIWEPKERSILDSQCRATVNFTVTINSHSHNSGSNVTFLWRHHGIVWSIWLHSSRFYFAYGFLQCDIQALQKEFNILGKHNDCYCLHCIGVGGSSGISATNSYRC